MPVVLIRATTSQDAATLARDLNNPNMDSKSIMRNLTKFLSQVGGGGIPGGPSVSITVIDEKAQGDHISVAVNNPVPGDELKVNGTSFKCVQPEEGKTKPEASEFFPGPLAADNLMAAIKEAMGEEMDVASSQKQVSIKQKDNEGQIELEAIGSGGLAVAGAGMAAFGMLTLNTNPKSGDEVTVAGSTFHGVTLDKPGDSDFQIGGDVSVTALSLAGVINANNLDVFAAALGPTILIRARKVGVAGNDIALEVPEGGPFSVSGPKLLSGSDPSVVNFNPGHFAPVTMTF